jgi:hypothetical protein
MTHQKHTPMDLMKPLVMKPPIDLIATYSRSEELRPRDHPVLTARQLGDSQVSVSTARFAGHVPVNPALDGRAPRGPGRWGKPQYVSTIS